MSARIDPAALGEPTLTARELYELLGHTSGSFVGILTERPGGGRRSMVRPVVDAPVPSVLTSDKGANIWASYNTTTERGRGKRGGVHEVDRLHAFVADLDFKDGAFGGPDEAVAYLEKVSEILGLPTALVFSGGGFHPVWAVAQDEDAHLETVVERVAANDVYKRMGAVLQSLAPEGVTLDSTFTIDRVWRLVGSLNYKSDPPVQVVAWRIEGAQPVSMATLRAVVDAHAPEAPAPVEDLPETEVRDAGTVCGYVQRMVTGWATDLPSRDRHGWLVSQATRLVAAVHAGCLPADLFEAARQRLVERFEELVGGERPTAAEVTRAFEHADKRAEGRSPAQHLHEELGGHTHDEEAEVHTDPETFRLDVEAGNEPDSWDPVDLDTILDGTYEPPVATIMPRTDGLCLIYPGLVHSFHGESESGKSLVMQYAAAQLLKSGGDVLYVDYESDAASVVGRLRELGAGTEEIRAHFTYIRPETKPGAEKWERLLARRFVLAVIDGVTDAFATFGLDSNSNDDVTAWVRFMPKTLADRTGAGVVVIDHVTKDSGTRGRFAMGGQAKMSGLTGAAYIVDVLVPLGRGRRGELVLRIGKDRPGSIRGQLPPPVEARKDRTEAVAHIVVDSGPSGINVTMGTPDPLVVPGRPRRDESGRVRYPEVMEKVSKRVELSGEQGMTRTAIKDAKAGNKDRVVAATDELVRLGYLVGKDGRDPNGHGVRLVVAPGRAPYRVVEDPLLNYGVGPLEPDDEDEDGPE